MALALDLSYSRACANLHDSAFQACSEDDVGCRLQFLNVCEQVRVCQWITHSKLFVLKEPREEAALISSVRNHPKNTIYPSTKSMWRQHMRT